MSDATARQIDGSEAENDLLDVVMGARQMLDRVARAAGTPAPPGSPPAEETLVLACLGLLSLRAGLARWLRAETAAGPDRAAPEGGDMRGLLR